MCLNLDNKSELVRRRELWQVKMDPLLYGQYIYYSFTTGSSLLAMWNLSLYIKVDIKFFVLKITYHQERNYMLLRRCDIVEIMVLFLCTL